MNITIKSWAIRKTIVNGEYASLKEAVVKNKTKMRWADLTGADLTGADLTGANLTDINLGNAILTNTKFL